MPKILLVDDEKAVKWALQQALADAGYEVETANSGEEGLLKAKENRFDLVVSDLRMPGISGLEMIRELKEHQPHLKAIVCSAYGSMESVVEAMRLGVNDFMVKPFKLARMRDAIGALLPLPAEEVAEEEPEEAGTEAAVPVSSAGSLPVVLPNLLTRPSLPVHLVGTEGPDGEARVTEGVFFDMVEEKGRHLILLGSSPRLGPSAQALALLVQGIFRNQLIHADDPSKAVPAFNETLWRSLHPRPSVSLFYGLYDPKSRELNYACTGDLVMGAIRRASGEDEQLQIERSPLGLFPGVMVSVRKVSLAEGDRLLLLGTARTELLTQSPDVEESFMEQVLPEVNWQDSRELARQIHAAVTAPGSAQRIADVTVIVVEPADSQAAMARQELSLSSAEQNLQPLLAKLGRLGQEAGISTDLMHDVTTAVVEAVNNAQTHAYPNGEGEISVRMALSNGEMVIEICDHGVGFDIHSYRPPDLQGYEGLTMDHGRGIYLVQQLMDRTLIESRPEQGTIVHMAKNIGSSNS